MNSIRTIPRITSNIQKNMMPQFTCFQIFHLCNIMAFYMKQDFLTINFHVLLYWWLSILQGIYLLFISCLIICFWINWVRIYKYTKIKGLHLREVTSLPKSQNVINMVHHFNHRRTKTACSPQDYFQLWPELFWKSWTFFASKNLFNAFFTKHAW